MSSTEEVLAVAETLCRPYLRTGMARHSYDAGRMIQDLMAERNAGLQHLADAPHMEYCQYSYLSGAENIRCTCWKAEL